MSNAGLNTVPDANGHFGIYGGRYVAETLMPALIEVEKAYRAAQADPAFDAEFRGLLRHYVGRPSPLYFAPRLTEALAGRKYSSSVKISTTRARIRSTIPLDRPFWHAGWGRRNSWRRQGLVSMA